MLIKILLNYFIFIFRFYFEIFSEIFSVLFLMYNKALIDIVKKFYHNNNFTIRYISSIFNISKSTIHRWIHYQNDDDKTKIFSKKINNFKKIITDELTCNPLLTAKDLQNIIFDKTNISVSISAIYIYIHQLGFKFKKLNKRKYQNKKIVLDKIKSFKNKIKNIKFKNIICLDETYFFNNSFNDYGWTQNINDSIVYTKSNPIKYSLIAAISCNKIIAYDILKNSNYNKINFINFLENKLLPKVSNKFILMDNVSFHKSKDVIDIFKNSNNTLLFIPPYSPQFNPIENVFAIIKQNYKKYSNNNKDINNIKNIIDSFDYDLYKFYYSSFKCNKHSNNIFL